ncbi:hypothetical protein [Legionella drancourtii]|uniref:Uncharacterized protein n=1 Tax=Legionella drancourtii LLAP12 TaxID=658187 RepID=G9ET49_9GAMM|nr:hypothetical protein [Legionella drancourtii]EHL29516.1 hypothetical protein LDG_8478 [Legionella drancourtii LLAP12]
MATLNSGLGFFPSVAAMVPVSPEYAYRIASEIKKMKSQVEKAAQIRQAPANLAAVAELEKCETALNAAINGLAVTATSDMGATSAKPDNIHHEVASTPSLR